MPGILTEVRKRELDASFESRRPLLVDAAKIIGGVGTMLDVGCGDGYFDLKMADVFKPRKIILTDIENSLEVQLPSNAEFQEVDVCSQDFLKRFQNKPTLVTCSSALHETVDMFKAVLNLINVLPVGGTTLIFDYSEEGL